MSSCLNTYALTNAGRPILAANTKAYKPSNTSWPALINYRGYTLK